MEVIVLKKCPVCGSDKTKIIDYGKRIMCPICHEWVWRNEPDFNKWADIYEKENENG